MYSKRLLGMAAGVLIGGLALGTSSNEAMGQLTLPWYTADGGGWTYSTEGYLMLGGTAGQIDAGTLEAGSLVLAGGFWLGGGAVVNSIKDPSETEVEEIAFRVQAGLPNPFAHATGIHLDLPEARSVEVSIFDHSGRLIRVLCDGERGAGHHRFTWDGRTSDG